MPRSDRSNFNSSQPKVSIGAQPQLGVRKRLGQKTPLGKAKKPRLEQPVEPADSAEAASQSWKSQFDLDDIVSSPGHNQDVEDGIESDSQVDTYESEEYLKEVEAKAEAGRAPGTESENAGQSEIKTEEKVDEETIEILSRNFYQMLRMRLEEEQDSRSNIIAGLSPWSDIVTFPIMGNSKSPAPKVLQSESAAAAFMMDRKINQLSEELYQYILSRSLTERARAGWQYSK